MGFGIIFTGYLFTVFDLGFIVNEALAVFVCKILCVIGYTTLIFGLRKFAIYSNYAKYALFAAVLYDAVMIFDCVVQGLWSFGAMEQSVMANIRTYSHPVNAVLFALVQVTLMYAIFDMGRQTECDKVRKNGIRSVAAASVYCIVNIVLSFPISLGGFFDAIWYGLFIVITFINAATLYSAYKYICLDTELEAERAEALKERTFKKDKK